jgi:hypothetical protein
MSKHAGTIAKSATLLATVAALVAASTPFATAADAAAVISTLDAPGAHDEIVDTNGTVAGDLVSERVTRVRLRIAGVTTIQRMPQATVPARTGMTFHPNYDTALSVGQMSAAWQAELDRLFPQPVTGGG